jgi:hypothetical protein
MASGPGRNAPCPCGSGRKYKVCCLAADQARERAERAAAAEAIALPPWAVDDPDAADPFLPLLPDLSDEDDVWEEFAAADYDEQVATFKRLLASHELDDELAFEMLSEIQDQARERGELGEFRALVERYAAELPDLYARDAPHYVGWLVDEALASGELERLPEVLAPFATDPLEAFDDLFRIAHQLMYAGHAAPLLDPLRRAWPVVDTTNDILPEGRQEYLGLLTELALLDYAATTPAPRSDDPIIATILPDDPTVDRAVVQENLAFLLGEAGRVWKPVDFESPPRTEPRERRLFLLGQEWAGEVWRRYDMPLARAVLAGELLSDFLAAHASKNMRAARLLVPSPRPLRRFLEAELDVLTYDQYPAAALVELLPLYLAFLEERALVEGGAVRRALAELRPVQAYVLRVLESNGAEPAIPAAIRGRWPTT